MGLVLAWFGWRGLRRLCRRPVLCRLRQFCFDRAGDPATADALCFEHSTQNALKPQSLDWHFMHPAIIPDHRPEEVHAVLN
jgi:hypothetical protein